MIKIEKTDVHGWEAAIRGMRNPMNSWRKSDSYNTYIENSETLNSAPHEFFVGAADYELMMKLANGGSTHAKYRRMVTVTCDITAPLYWWKEYDAYKVGTVANSCSTMHKIHSKDFELNDFSHEHLSNQSLGCLGMMIKCLNSYRRFYENEPKKEYWWQLIQLLPSSYNQKRTLLMNYEVLAGIYKERKNHKLDEWHTFCDWIEQLPYSEIITMQNSI